MLLIPNSFTIFVTVILRWSAKASPRFLCGVFKVRYAVIYVVRN
mgnify:FL=1